MNPDSISNPKVNSKDEWSSERHSLGFLKKADKMPHRSVGENVLFDHIPKGAIRVLDLGTGNGRLLRLLKNRRPDVSVVAVDVSPPMLD
ncbi:MAG TPA: methyltransferase domain-containing protein, partial [Candidatus Nitrosocosmicus sp.]|nr:methyltransferase domain-containing protein [Candidatus Nitrosocosmicus sp.]